MKTTYPFDVADVRWQVNIINHIMIQMFEQKLEYLWWLDTEKIKRFSMDAR